MNAFPHFILKLGNHVDVIFSLTFMSSLIRMNENESNFKVEILKFFSNKVESDGTLQIDAHC